MQVEIFVKNDITRFRRFPQGSNFGQTFIFVLRHPILGNRSGHGDRLLKRLHILMDLLTFNCR